MSLHGTCQDGLLKSPSLSYQIFDVISMRASVRQDTNSLRTYTKDIIGNQEKKESTYTRIMSCSMIGPSSSLVVA
jgi:hypothetical protein